MTPAPRRIDQPRPGHFRIKLVRRGPWVAARIDHDGRLWSAVIDGQTCGLPHEDPTRADGVFRIWTSGQPIDQGEYDYILALAEWARAHAPTHPAANPDKPIDILGTPIYGGNAR